MDSPASQNRNGYFSFEAGVTLNPARADSSGSGDDSPRFAILRWTRGAGRLRFENCETQIAPLSFNGETLALLSPDARLEFEGQPPPQIQGSRIRFDETFLCAREDNATLLAHDSVFYTAPLSRPTAAQGEILGRLHRDIAENQHDHEIARAYLKILMLKIQSFAENRSGKQQDSDLTSGNESGDEAAGDARRFQEFRRLVETNFRELHRPAQYAERMFLSTRCLNAITNASAGSSPSRIIQNRLILEARRLLRGEDRTVAAVARELGFADADYFGRFFHKHAGQTPGAFRKEHASGT